MGQHFDPETMTAVLNVLYNGAFYTGEEDGGSAGGVLVKVNVVTGEVKLLMSKATTGENCLFRNACEYEGKLYFCGSVNSLPCIYQVDPETGCLQAGVPGHDPAGLYRGLFGRNLYRYPGPV